MSSEADHPRQRTVAELLAQHGDTSATGRRRRRREPDDPVEDGPAPAANDAAFNGARPGAPAWPPAGSAPGSEHSPVREPAPREPPAGQPSRNTAAWETPQREQVPPRDMFSRPEPLPQRERPQPGQQLPKRDQSPARDLFRDPPLPFQDPSRPEGQRRESSQPEVSLWEPVSSSATPQGTLAPGAATQGVAPAPTPAPTPTPTPMPHPLGGVFGRSPVDPPTEKIARVRGDHPGGRDPQLTGPIQYRSPGAAPAEDGDADEARPDGPDGEDDGPPTMVGAAPVGAEEWHWARTAGRDAAAANGGPPTQASTPLDFDEFGDHPAGLGGSADATTATRAVESTGSPRSSRDAGEPAAQSWAPVLAQWILGAIGGAALWVGFRYLWGNLLVVAIAASVLVTAGLVVVVRALLRNNDIRTTVMAVLVGLLLTVSPVALVLMGR